MHEMKQEYNALSIKELDQYGDEIAEFLASKTAFDVETIMRNISVLEVTMALHKVFDLTQDTLLFDDASQSLVHHILNGESEQMKLRSVNTKQHYQNEYQGLPGESLALGCAKAMDNPNRTIVIIDDHALNHGTTYEALLEIGRLKPNLTLVLMDEQKSLLRHYNSMNSAIKSVRISKVYTETKRDMKNVLGSNALSRPLLNTLTHFRDVIKDAVIEPTIFSQFGFDYHGPINGQNLNDLVKIFKLSKSMSGPHVIHVQTRVKEKKHRKLEFPAFKTDHDIPENYSNYTETLDRVMSLHSDILMINDIKYPSDHYKSIQMQYPERYHTTNGSVDLMVPMMAGLIQEGSKPVISISSKYANQLIGSLQHHLHALPSLVIIIKDAGLNSQAGAMNHGIYDVSLMTTLPQFEMKMAKDMNEASYLLEYALNQSQFMILRIPDRNEKIQHEVLQFEDIWDTLVPFTSSSEGVIISVGPSVKKLQRKIEINNLNIGLINARSMNRVDLKKLKDVYDKGLKVLIYNCEGQYDILSQTIYQAMALNGFSLDIHSLNLEGVDLSLSAKQMKDKYQLNIDDCMIHFNQ